MRSTFNQRKINFNAILDKISPVSTWHRLRAGGRVTKRQPSASLLRFAWSASPYFLISFLQRSHWPMSWVPSIAHGDLNPKWSLHFSSVHGLLNPNWSLNRNRHKVFASSFYNPGDRPCDLKHVQQALAHWVVDPAIV